MTNLLYLSLAVGIAMLVAAIALIVKKRCHDAAAICIRETWMTAVMGAMMIALGLFFPIAKLMDATLAGTEASSYWFVIGFGLLCHAMGDFTLLFSLVKCVALYEDRAVAYSALGRQTTIYWDDVVKVDKPLMRSTFVLTDCHGNSINVSGEGKAMKTFVAFAKPKVTSAGGANLVSQVEHRLSGRH
ncbi:MAG: hypothetical protein ACI3V0_00680 [Faecousia sp.]